MTDRPDLAPSAPRTSLLRIAVGLAAACALLTAIATALAWGVYALNFDDAYGVSARTWFAAKMIGVGLGVFSITAAPLAIAGALALGRRSIGAFALAGGIAGAAFGGLGMAMGDAEIQPAALIALALVGALHLAITRAAAGIRRKA